MIPAVALPTYKGREDRMKLMKKHPHLILLKRCMFKSKNSQCGALQMFQLQFHNSRPLALLAADDGSWIPQHLEGATLPPPLL